MISFNQPEIALLGHPVLVKIVSNAYEVSPGSFAVYQVEFNSVPNDGDTMELSWGNESFVFTFKNSPGESAFELKRTADPLSTWFTFTLQGQILSNLYLQKFFTISFGTNLLRLTAKQAGGEFDISGDFSTTYATGTLTSAGAQPVLRPELRLTGTLEYNDLTNANKQTVKISMNTNEGEAYIDMHDFISRDYLPYEVVPLFPTTPVNVSKRILYAQLSIAEQFGTNQFAFNKSTNSDKLYMLPGGVSEQDFKTLALDDKLSTGQGLLSTVQNRVTISPTQPFFLNVMNYVGDARDIKLSLTATLADGSSQSHYAIIENSTNKRNTYQVPLHYAYIINLLQVSMVLEFDIQFFVSNSPSDVAISPTVTVQVDHELHEDEMLLLYENSLGFFEIMRLTGKVQEIAEPQNEYVETMLYDSVQSTSLTRGGKNHSAQYRLGFVKNSGHKHKEEMLHLLDMLVSPDVRLIQGSEQIPVVVRPENTTLFESHKAFLGGANIIIYYAEYNKYVSHGRYSN